jgi:hypothetical protein
LLAHDARAGLAAQAERSGNASACEAVADELIRAIDEHWRHREYFDVPPELAAVDTAKLGGQSAGFVEATWNTVLLRLCLRSDAEQLPQFPAALAEHVRVQLRRIVGFVAADEYAKSRRLPLRRDLLHKDLGVARLSMLPAAARLCDVYGGIPRKQMLAGFPDSAPLYWRAIAIYGGLKPYFGTHLHIPLYGKFNREGFADDFLLIADYLELMPQVRGSLSFGWHLDPYLYDVSPHLAHNRQIPESYGAKYMRMGSNEDLVRNALSKSKTRQALYDAGKYRPQSFLGVWGRKDIMRWRDDYRAGRFRV